MEHRAALPVYTMDELACMPADRVVAAITTPPVEPGNLEALLRCLLPTAPVPTPPPRADTHIYQNFAGTPTVRSAGVIGSNVPWLECPACNALTWVITVTE